MKLSYCFIASFLMLFSLKTFGHLQADSLIQQPKQLKEILISSYPSNQALNTTPASISIVDSQLLQFRTQPTLVSTLNIIPGVRMEERSPGSYRLSLRGSLLRSPFGVRDVKVYLDEFPLTDGGGNTYLNCINLTDNSRLEIIKGPDGSLFGANTGGVVHLIPSGINEAQKAVVSIGGGSYGMFTEEAGSSFQLGKHLLNVQESYYRSDGYRDNSALHKVNLNLSDNWEYTSKAHLKLLLSYNDLYYQTPGGLTFQQMQNDPVNARLATSTLPSAVDQKAAVYTKLLFMGVSNTIALSNHLNHVIDVYGSFVDFKNPFITNYEVRKEHTQGIRSYLEWHDTKTPKSLIHWTLHVGGEWTQTNADIHNYDNNSGEKGNLQAMDNIDSRQYFFFTRMRTTLAQKWIIEAALSLNYAGYHFNESPKINDNFNPQWMPKLATSYKVSSHFVIRSSVSRGYSTPTTAEIRPSNNQLYLGLQPEYGWNYEAGIRANALQHRLTAELTIFHFRLHDAIVSHLDDKGTAYFTNAGETRQTGLETSISYQLLQQNFSRKIIESLFVFNNTTWNAFHFHNYNVDDKDYSGNRLTGVPAIVNVLGIRCNFKRGFSISTTYNHTGNLPLDDGNTTFASAYNLLQATIGKQFSVHGKLLELNIGLDNLLNETYSLGNDINAAGGRYYNPAPKRNFLASVKMTL